MDNELSTLHSITLLCLHCDSELRTGRYNTRIATDPKEAETHKAIISCRCGRDHSVGGKEENGSGAEDEDKDINSHLLRFVCQDCKTKQSTLGAEVTETSVSLTCHLCGRKHEYVIKH